MMASLQRRKYKTSELPINAAQRGAIDQLLLTFKKKGGFDSLRRDIWNEYGNSDAKNAFTTALTDVAESEIDREPSLLSRERGKAATLIEGAIDRSNVYKTVEADMDNLIVRYLDQVLSTVREIRKQEIGEDLAVEEQRNGDKTDEDYERETEARRQERDRIRLRQQELQKQIEEEKAKIRAEEQRKERELAKRKEAEERAKDAEREERKRLEREKEREELRILEEQREKEREERYERRRREEKERQKERDAAYSSRRMSISFEHSTTPKDRSPPQAPPADEKSLEEAALELLLKEGQELAAKSKQKPEFDFEQAEKGDSTRKTQSFRLREEERRSSRGDIRESRERTGHSSRRQERSDSHDRKRVREPTDDYEHRTKYRRYSRSRSRERHRDDVAQKAERDEYEAKKLEATMQREKEAEAYKRATRDSRETREASHRTRSKSAGRDYERERERGHRRDRDRDRDRSRSRSPRRRGRSRTRSPRRNHRERSRRRHSRSRSPPTTVQPIDRYVPEGGKRSPAPVRRIKHRDSTRSPPRRRERDDDRRGEERRGYVEIDRYVPGK